jgi:hypothetical protein
VRLDPTPHVLQPPWTEATLTDPPDLLGAHEIHLLQHADVLLEPVSDMPKGSASSPMVAGPRPRRSRMALRVGSDKAEKVRSSAV